MNFCHSCSVIVDLFSILYQFLDFNFYLFPENEKSINNITILGNIGGILGTSSKISQKLIIRFVIYKKIRFYLCTFWPIKYKGKIFTNFHLHFSIGFSWSKLLKLGQKYALINIFMIDKKPGNLVKKLTFYCQFPNNSTLFSNTL